MKYGIYIVIGVVFSGIIGMYFGIILDQSQFHQNQDKDAFPIILTPEDFENGIAFTDLNSIEGVSQEEVIIVDGIIEYEE